MNLKTLGRKPNTVVRGTEENGSCTLHSHTIAEWSPQILSISLCGWNTVTTRRRLNQLFEALNLPVRIYTEKGEVFLYSKGTFCLLDDHNNYYTIIRVKGETA